MDPPPRMDDDAPTPTRSHTTTLPSIGALLRDAGPTQPAYNSARHSSHPASSSANPPMQLQANSNTYSEGNQDSDEGDVERSSDPPPKKRRRRQALSCTECKRRKIKCDRNHPCGPCSRRNEQDKCQWHVLEPVEKYVTRSEYEELKARFDHLESVVNGMVAGGGAGPSHSHDTSRDPSAATFRGRERSFSGSINSSGEAPRAFKREPQGYADPLHSPRPGMRIPRMVSPHLESRAEPPIRHRLSHERSPSGGSNKGILKILQADAELANGRHSPDRHHSRSVSPAPGGRSPSSLSITSVSSVGDHGQVFAFRTSRPEPNPPHYVRSIFYREECCDDDCGPYCLPPPRLYSSSYYT